MVKTCVSCGRLAAQAVSFPCPGCGKTLVRCADCREGSNKYKCPDCGFKGP